MNITIEDVSRFLGNSVDFNEDLKFQDSNIRALKWFDGFAVARRLGRTEERYEREIQVYTMILSAKNTVTSPIPQSYHYHTQYNPLAMDVKKYQDYLHWHTNNIPAYLAIKYGAQGLDWVLDKFGQDVKRQYYSLNNR